jgi:farnesyl diphosphate synthase
MLEEFEIFLKNNLPKVESFHPDFNSALSEMLDAGGKRFRPLLLLSVVQNSEPLLVKNAMHIALAIEMLHTYSLIHDDLPAMDDAELRRGHPTLHVSYDEVTAILVGDALNTHAFYMIANAPLSDEVKVKLSLILARDGGISGMIIGQAIDCKFEDKKLSIDELRFLHVNKTAKLIAASLLMGAVIGGVTKEEEKSIYEFGLKLGLLFQVQDDIIDATLSSEEAGKPTGNDEHKNSFVNLLGIDGANAEKQKLIKELNEETNKLNDNLAKTLQQIISNYFKG